MEKNEPFVKAKKSGVVGVGALAAAALLGLAAAATAQTVKETLEVTRQAIESQRRVLVSGALPLTDAEADAFWPLYDDYEKERRPLDEQREQARGRLPRRRARA